ncbi:MAG: ribonucleoside-triphosphate reductase, adenosylcobalamin-dependent [Acidimicrobiales bacterium]|jgi:adenosylcobalamin-dependent ribonucleoside-triphosphate reductase|nr:ribonucleoside-triphosphate reductase, adenosylcobalamin-dependent [Acidimicrobiales bacterium]
MNSVFGPLGRLVYNRTYSRRLLDGTHEDWPDTVRRVVAGNCALVPDEFIQPGERERLTDLIESMALLPGGRHLYSTGVPGRQFSFNCHHTGWGERLRDHCGFLMNVLMTGGGSGSSYTNSAIGGLPLPAGEVEPRFTAPTHVDRAEFAHRLSPPSAGGVVYRVPDSREGWVEALCRLTDLAEDGGGTITFDMTDVRPRGSAINGFGGTASGPAPLIELLINVADLLNRCVGQSFTSMDLMEIDHAIAACVIAGNVRRSARQSIKSWRDHDILDFVHAKADPSQHWSTNLSVAIDDEFISALKAGIPQARVVFDAVIDGMVRDGEPGLWNESLASIGERGDLCPNPCGEIGLEAFEPCCLGHINLAHYGNDLRGTAEAVRLMTRFLIRATHADIDDPRQRAVVERNRRIGVGLLGYQEWGAAHGYRYSQIHASELMGAKLKILRDEAKSEARTYAAALGIPTPIKTTCVAPTGTVSTLPGVTSGIHPIFSRYFVRRVRFAADDPLLEDHVAAGHHIEDDRYAANTKVVSLPCRDPILDRYDGSLVEQANEISPGDLLATQAFVQRNWADNAVSFTVNITPDVGRGHLAEAIQHFLPQLKGTTAFPDVSRPQSPYERIDESTWAMAAGAETGQVMDQCVNGACPVR